MLNLQPAKSQNKKRDFNLKFWLKLTAFVGVIAACIALFSQLITIIVTAAGITAGGYVATSIIKKVVKK